MEESEVLNQMGGMSRQHYGMVWQLALAGAPLTIEQMRLVRVMQEHPEYRSIWDNPEEASAGLEDLTEPNPFLHVTAHMMVEEQIAGRNPPDVAVVVSRLTRSGDSRHEAIHKVANVLMGEVWDVLAKKREFDREKYVRRLGELLQKGTRRAWRA